MKTVQLSVDLVNEIANYITSRPLGEVLPLFEKLRKEIEDQTKPEIPTLTAEEI